MTFVNCIGKRLKPMADRQTERNVDFKCPFVTEVCCVYLKCPTSLITADGRQQGNMPISTEKTPIWTAKWCTCALLLSDEDLSVNETHTPVRHFLNYERTCAKELTARFEIGFRLPSTIWS